MGINGASFSLVVDIVAIGTVGVETVAIDSVVVGIEDNCESEKGYKF